MRCILYEKNKCRYANLQKLEDTLKIYTVDGVLLPVVDVDDPDAEDEPLQLALVEHLDEVQWNELAEAGQELRHLFRKK
jgi:hypothetical protein